MDILTIRHFTRYRYAKPVWFGEHHMMFRPRESFDQHVLDSTLMISPEPAVLHYQHDVFGNCIGIAQFAAKSQELTFESFCRLEHRPENALDQAGSQDNGMNSYPFAYRQSDLPDLYSSMQRSYRYSDGALDRWARRFLQNLPRVDVRHVLTAMTRAIHDELKYLPRTSGLPQHPIRTLQLGSGTCRDFAVLMMEAVRTLGLAVRFVSGYLHIPDRALAGQARSGDGNTHAWVRVFLPNGGWAEFDPTNGLVGNRDLIRVAVAREPSQALPLYGTWEGAPNDFIGMDLEVEVRSERRRPTKEADAC